MVFGYPRGVAGHLFAPGVTATQKQRDFPYGCHRNPQDNSQVQFGAAKRPGNTATIPLLKPELSQNPVAFALRKCFPCQPPGDSFRKSAGPPFDPGRAVNQIPLFLRKGISLPNIATALTAFTGLWYAEYNKTSVWTFTVYATFRHTTVSPETVVWLFCVLFYKRRVL